MKKTILLVHGYRGSPLGLAATKHILEKKGYKVYAPAIAPFGGAGELPEYTAQSFADYLARYVRENHLKKPVVVGHSMGSIIAAAFAEKYPELSDDKMILLAPIAGKVPRFMAKLTPLTVFLPNRMISFITSSYLFAGDGGMKQFRDIYRITVECAADRASRKSDRLAAKFSANSAISDFKFKKQAVFIAGAKDRMNSVEKVKQVAKKFKAKVVILEGTGHLMNYECPERLAEAIDENIG